MRGGAEHLVVLALFLGDEFGLFAEHGFVVLAVDGDLDVFRLDHAIELDLEIEGRAGKNRGTVERIDGGGLCCTDSMVADTRASRSVRIGGLAIVLRLRWPLP